MLATARVLSCDSKQPSQPNKHRIVNVLRCDEHPTLINVFQWIYKYMYNMVLIIGIVLRWCMRMAAY